MLDLDLTQAERTALLKDLAGTHSIRVRVNVHNRERDEQKKFPPKNGLVFEGTQGGPIHANNFNKRVWKPALRAAGLSEPFPRPHDLRHTMVSMADRHESPAA
jgi:integrase